MADFAHLHVHSEYSLLDGVGRIEHVIARAQSHGMDALALTDHGVMYGAIEFYSAAKKAGIKPIVGCEVYVASGSRADKRPKIDTSPQHLVLLAENNAGYRNLIQLVTKAHVEGFYYKPRVDKDLLAAHSEGIICLSACASGEVPRLIQAGDEAGALAAAAWYREVYGNDRYFIELQRHEGLDWLENINRGLLTIARNLDLTVVATNDVHYVDSQDARAQDLLLCIQTNATVDDPKRMRMAGQSYYLKSVAEMEDLFSDYPDALRNTREVVDRCNLTIEFGQALLPEFEIPVGYTPETYLEMLCREGVKKRFNRLTPEIDQRLRYEIEVIRETGFPLYILIVWDIVSFARRRGIMYGPRGSAAGSLVLYCLGISDVDPVSNNLTFERFLNIERKEMPDIDMDFADDRRDEVIEYVAQKYGRDHVAQIVTFGTLGAKAAIRDIGRARGLAFGDVDRVAKLIPTLPAGITIEQSMEDNPELKRLYEEDSTVQSLIDDARSIEGIARHSSTHAAGVVISREPLDWMVPLQQTSRNDEALMTQYPSAALAQLGLLKMDFLGLANLTILGRTLEIIRQTRGREIDLQRLPIDDPKTYEILARGETVGVFQLEGSGMTRYMKELRPTTIGDVAAMIALYRPGPMGNIPHYIARKHGAEPVEYPHPLLEETLRDTYGVLTYQDQVLQVLRRVAGYSLGQADIVRKAMSKKIRALMEKEQTRFFDGARQNGLSDEDAQRIWDLLEPFAGYGFNRAHAACYAMVAFQTAHLKANYPVEYMTAVLRAAMGNGDRVVIAVAEARRLGIEVRGPDVNRSDVGFTIESGPTGQAIRFGLAAVKNVGESAIQPIIDGRSGRGAFASIDDFCQRVELRGINKRVLESLIKSGAFDGMARRSQLLAVLDRLIGLAQKARDAAESGQTSMFDFAPSSPEVTAVALPEVPEVAPKDRVAWEKELLGIYLTEHPLQRLLRSPAFATATRIDEISEETVGQKVSVAGLITGVRTVLTKKRDTMVIATLEDIAGSLEMVAFPRAFEKTREVWQEERMVLATGKVESREERLQLVVETIEEIHSADNGDCVEDDGEQLPAPFALNATEPTLSPAARESMSASPSPPRDNVPGGEIGLARQIEIVLQRSGNDQIDLQLFEQIHVILDGQSAGADDVTLVLTGGNRPRVELEWPTLHVRCDSQLQRQLTGLVGPAAIRVHPMEGQKVAV